MFLFSERASTIEEKIHEAQDLTACEKFFATLGSHSPHVGEHVRTVVRATFYIKCLFIRI